MTTIKSKPIKCGLCGYTLPENALACPNCGMNLYINKLIDKIPRAEPNPGPAAVTPRDGQAERHKSEKVPPNDLASKLFPELSVAIANRLDLELEQEEKRQTQPEPAPAKIAPVIKPIPPAAETIIPAIRPVPPAVEPIVPAIKPVPLAAETVVTTPQAYVTLLPAISPVDLRKSSRSHSFSRVWILSALLLAGLVFLFMEYLVKSDQLLALSNAYRNPQNTQIAQGESLRRAESTISAQQNTIIAQQNTLAVQQTRIPDQVDPNLPPLFGPVDGTLVHNIDGLIKTYWANQDSKNFIMSVVMVNPYASTYHPWSTCIRFRRNYTDEYRLTIFSTQQWALTFGQSLAPIASGTLTNLKTGGADSNTVYLDVRDEIALLKLNDLQVAYMDVSTYQEAGDIGIAIGSRKGDEVNGKTTDFKAFELWKVP